MNTDPPASIPSPAASPTRTPGSAPSPPLVTVIVPAFNPGATLGQTLASVRNQTSTDYEIVVVDDGSTDATAALVHRLARDDQRVRLISQANAGMAAARNRSIEAARGEFFGLPGCR